MTKKKAAYRSDLDFVITYWKSRLKEKIYNIVIVGIAAIMILTAILFPDPLFDPVIISTTDWNESCALRSGNSYMHYDMKDTHLAVYDRPGGDEIEQLHEGSTVSVELWDAKGGGNNSYLHGNKYYVKVAIGWVHICTENKDTGRVRKVHWSDVSQG